MNIVFVASEVFPFAKTGGLADVCGTLPVELAKAGHDVSIIMPNYRCVGSVESFNDRANMAMVGGNVSVYFIKNRKYFDRPYLYGENMGNYPDSVERFAFFCRQALELLKDIGRPVDIIHCNDWQTGLVPVFLKEEHAGDPFFLGTRVVFTVHNHAYQGVFSAEDFSATGLDRGLLNDKEIGLNGKICLLKAGVVFSDFVTTVSPRYSREILGGSLKLGIEDVFEQKKVRFEGILNGLDYGFWDPERDPLIDPKYSAQDRLARKAHKKKLQAMSRLQVMEDVPLFGFVGRFCFQKGLDLVESAFEGIMERPVQLVMIGIGEPGHEKKLAQLAKKYPQKFAAHIRYDEDVVHQVFAGSDLFLMPSVYEPCGLAQMIAMRYGSVPVVSAVGGLADTVKDFSSDHEKGNGFVLGTYSVAGILAAMDRAAGVFHQKERFSDLVGRVMACRWTWAASVRRYLEVYQTCLS